MITRKYDRSLILAIFLLLSKERTWSKCVAFSFHSSLFKHRSIIHSESSNIININKVSLTSTTLMEARKREKSRRNFEGTKQNQMDNDLVGVLETCNFGNRIFTFNEDNLPLVAEVHADGKWQLCVITGLKVTSAVLSSKQEHDDLSPPLVEVLLIDDKLDDNNQEIGQNNFKVVDVGQITTIWNTSIKSLSKYQLSDVAMKLLKNKSQVELSTQKFPVNHIEKSMQLLYEDCVKDRKGTSLTKKQIKSITSTMKPDSYAEHLDQILRRGLKAGLGTNKRRLVDSRDAATLIYNGENKIHSQDDKQSVDRIVGAILLARDAELGGRFKRSGCIFVSAKYDLDNSPTIREVTILNGGWSAVDESVRAGIEGRKFAERRIDKGEQNTASSGKALFTTADERILHRLECLAMGEKFQKGDDARQLELDVRESLSAMNLPLTSNGAQLALIRAGRWTESDRNNASSRSKSIIKFEPWSQEILESAKLLVEREEKRRRTMLNKCLGKGSTTGRVLEGRVNLFALPCVCVDAKRATFRDDAIGVRLRSSTGRKVDKAASKWEVMIHIADVSDLYSPDILRPAKDTFDFETLRKASESRGSSRYDLPFGPLHLLPPVALEALALVTKGMEETDKSIKRSPVNRCVTLWAYIDERNGRLLDAGLERTIISAPIALSFENASEVLEETIGVNSMSSSFKQAKAVLTIAENNLSLWKEDRLKTEKAASQREKRLQIREMVAKEIISTKHMRDDGSKGSFQRTRGHRLVDTSLDMYGSTLSKLLYKANVPIPRASGSSADRDGRVATAPLRRYIDGVAQRQALSALLNYGGPSMTPKECTTANRITNNAINRNNMLRSTKMKGPNKAEGSRTNKLQILENHLSTRHNSKSNLIVPALSTGRENEVVISGSGIVAKCSGVKGLLKGGERVLVEIIQLDVKKGILQLRLVNNSLEK